MDQVKVLILDDDDDDIFLINDAIDDIVDSNYCVQSTQRPDEASEILHRREVDIVLCDYRLGHMTGIEFIREHRQQGIDTPIILLTGMNSRSTDEAALDAGASDFVSKVNIHSDSLDRSIRYALANAKKQRVFQSVLDNVNAGVVLIDENLKPNLWNPEFQTIASAVVEGQGKEAVESFATKVMAEDRIMHVGSKIYEKKVTYTADNSTVMLLHEVTDHINALKEREEAENKAAHLAMNCSLTGLPNRNSFADRIKEELERAKEDSSYFYILNLDLDKFKEVNDVYGHKTGDALLRKVAERFKEVCGEEEFLARLGGDEFVAIQRCTEATQSIPTLARRLYECLEAPLIIDDVQLQIGVSIGVSRYPEHGETAEELLSNADTAMYRSKRKEVSKVHAFSEEMDRKIREARVLAVELRKAVEDNQIEVYFQPQADVTTGEITGFEALARWQHPELGYVSPNRFIPLAEEGGLISRIGQQILEKACNVAVKWPKPYNVAVNVSPMQVRDTNFLEHVRNTLMTSGLPSKRLELEITESILIDDKIRALHVLRGLKNLGIAIAIDDFGTGFSSLSTLISFPFDKIKIDKSFIDDCHKNTQAALVTKTILNLGAHMGCDTIAEGVESKEHLEFLRQEGCNSIQGFLIGKPTHNDDLHVFFEDHFSYEDTTSQKKSA